MGTNTSYPRGVASFENVLFCICAGLLAGGAFRERQTPSTQVRVITGRAGCAVELDSTAVGKTDTRGILELSDVEPLDHYLHILCPGQKQEGAYFISLRRGENLKVHHEAAPAGGVVGRPVLQAAEAKIKLRQNVQEAVRLRAAGRLEDAVQLLHEAAKLDPENSDLHRELGITFLLDKDWKRARVEMLEAIRHDPNDADAHNGLGYALEKLGDLDGALKEFRTATRLEPDDSSYRQHYLEALGKIAAKQPGKK